jgi:pyruvate dehydrogenase E2 component (dihydrolipoamide acetyltransferase)
LATIVRMPKFSATMEDAAIVMWCKAAGDRVLAGEALLEIETDKSTLTIESPVAGRLGTPAVVAGERAAVGATLVAILAEDDIETPNVAPGPPENQLANPPISNQEPAQGRARPVRDDNRVRASPLARRLARDRGIELAAVKGSGPSGRILASDARAQQTPLAATPPARALATDLLAARRRIASEVSASQREIPAFVVTRWIDMEATVAGLGAAQARRTETDCFLFAIAAALIEVEEFRCVWNASAEAPEALDDANVGLVVSTERGLVIPILKSLAAASIEAISERRREAVAASREGRLHQRLVGRASVSLSSLIHGEADSFEAIISPGQTAMVAVGRITDTVVAQRGGILIRRGCMVSVSADHRVIDGGVSARFIGVIARVIEAGHFDQPLPHQPRASS